MTATDNRKQAGLLPIIWALAWPTMLEQLMQTAAATLGTAAVLSEVNWLAVGSAALLAGLLSLLTSLGGLPEVTA